VILEAYEVGYAWTALLLTQANIFDFITGILRRCWDNELAQKSRDPHGRGLSRDDAGALLCPWVPATPIVPVPTVTQSIECISNGIMRDSRVFHIEDPDWFRKYNDQSPHLLSRGSYHVY
jgi:hypothetical protein